MRDTAYCPVHERLEPAVIAREKATLHPFAGRGQVPLGTVIAQATLECGTHKMVVTTSRVGLG